MGDIIIRPMALVDVEPLTKVINAAYRGHGGWTTEAALVEGQRISESDLRLFLKDEDSKASEPIFVAQLGSDIIGCIQPTLNSHDNSHEQNESASMPQSAVPDANAGQINGNESRVHLSGEKLHSKEAMLGLFAVSPSVQSRGIGRALVDKAFDHMVNVWEVGVCVIWVLEERTEILKWYAKLGFEWDGKETREFVWPDKLKKSMHFRVLKKKLGATQ